MKNILLFFILFSLCLSTNGQILKKKIPNKLVVLSFDDATASQYTEYKNWIVRLYHFQLLHKMKTVAFALQKSYNFYQIVYGVEIKNLT